MFRALANLARFIITPRVAKHRVFLWAYKGTVPDTRLYVFASADPFVFGVLHSRMHEVWSLATCSWHGVGNDPTYDNTTCFETFPFPWPPNTPEGTLTPKQRTARDEIIAAAKELDEKRNRWLNPPELATVVPDAPLPPRLVPVTPEAAATLKTRTLTQLYNQRPAWLALLHKELDRAVFAAYGLSEILTDDQLLAELLKLNHARTPADAPKGSIGEPDSEDEQEDDGAA